MCTPEEKLFIRSSRRGSVIEPLQLSTISQSPPFPPPLLVWSPRCSSWRSSQVLWWNKVPLSTCSRGGWGEQTMAGSDRLINNSQAVLKPIFFFFFYSTGGSFTTRELQQKCNPGFGAKHFYRWERSYCCSQNRGSRFHYDCVDRLQRFRVSVSFLPSNSSPRPLVFGSLITLRYSETKNRH